MVHAQGWEETTKTSLSKGWNNLVPDITDVAINASIVPPDTDDLSMTCFVNLVFLKSTGVA